MKLTAHRYGKSRVRVLKVLRDGPVHTVKEVTARILLDGAFARSFTDADNTAVVATDSMKNTINVLAHDHLGVELEPFARCVADHFLGRYAQVSRVSVTLDERVWTRMTLPAGGTYRPAPAHHPHSFTQSQVARPFTRLVAGRDGDARHDSGVRQLLILKSTGSGFEAFLRDDLTTLPETKDRILATAARATWRWREAPAKYGTTYDEANRAIVSAMLVPFAERYSPSVQATLYEMATAGLEACPAIARVSLVMPNLHCLPIDLTPFGRTNRQTLFVPTDEPHGYIEATVVRES